ncbi:MAG: hypothetical protein LDL41_05360 [Coleofasciculus sp. S288]|nr:hypothetical protein [Coleofasciculus sp. S288]
MGLSEGLKDRNKKASVAADCVKLIDEHVATKGGLGGLGLKAAYGTVKGVMPNYINGAIERLLPEAFAALDPIWSEGVQTGNPVEYLTQNRSRTADALLSVTDARIEKTNNGIVRGSYSKLRNSAKSDVEEAVPGLAKILDNYTKG